MTEGPNTDSEVAFFDAMIVSAMSGIALELEKTDTYTSDAKLIEMHRWAVKAAQLALDARRKR